MHLMQCYLYQLTCEAVVSTVAWGTYPVAFTIAREVPQGVAVLGHAIPGTVTAVVVRLTGHPEAEIQCD